MDKVKKIYKPGQIVTIKNTNKESKVFRVVKIGKWASSCANCDLNSIYFSFIKCSKYCYEKHNDKNKNPNGYVLKEIRNA